MTQAPPPWKTLGEAADKVVKNARRNLPEGPGSRAARLRREEIERMHEDGTQEANNG